MGGVLILLYSAFLTLTTLLWIAHETQYYNLLYNFGIMKTINIFKIPNKNQKSNKPKPNKKINFNAPNPSFPTPFILFYVRMLWPQRCLSSNWRLRCPWPWTAWWLCPGKIKNSTFATWRPQWVHTTALTWPRPCLDLPLLRRFEGI